MKKIIKIVLVLLFLGFSVSEVLAATLYGKASGGNWSAAATWSTTGSGGGDSSGPPTAADNVILEAGTGNITIDAAAVARSLDTTSGTGTYAGTLTHNAGFTLSLGDATAGAGNVALKFTAGMTYTLGSATTSAIAFVSTSATQQTITSAGKTLGIVSWNGVGGSWILSDALVTGTATANILTLTNGALSTGNQTVTSGAISSDNANIRSLSLGSSTINLGAALAWEMLTTTNLTFTAGTSTINFTHAGPALHPGGLTFNNVNITALASANAGLNSIGGAGGLDSPNLGGGTTGPVNTFATFSITGTAVKTNKFHFATPTTVTGTLTFAGNSAINRLLIWSGGYLQILGFPALITATGATVTVSNADFQDITMTPSQDLSAITGNSGDCGGNTGLTLTTPQEQFWSSNTGSWSDSAQWRTATGGGGSAGRVPLCQDDARFDASAFSTGSQTVTVDMPRLGKAINMTSIDSSPTFSVSNDVYVYGSLTFTSGLTWTQDSNNLNIECRGACSLTRATRVLAGPMNVTSPGGTLTFQDDVSFPSSTTHTFTLNQGTLNTNNQNVSFRRFSSSNSQTRAITLGSSAVALASTGTVWTTATATNLTLTPGTSTITISDTSSSSKTFSGGGKTFNNVSITGSGTGAVTISGSNTYNILTIGAPKTVTFTAGTTHTASSFVITGSSGNVITLQTSSAGTPASLSKSSSTVTADYASIQDITATGGARWDAQNSTNVSGNAGWIFGRSNRIIFN